MMMQVTLPQTQVIIFQSQCVLMISGAVAELQENQLKKKDQPPRHKKIPQAYMKILLV